MSTDLLGLRGKNAFVVGGGVGIGESTCLRLAEAGCNIAVGDIDQARADAMVARLAAMGVKAVSIVGDIIDPAKVEALVSEAEDKLGGIDVTSMIVGGPKYGPLLTLPVEVWDENFALNLRYVFMVAREVAKRMIAAGRPGAISCLSSVSGINGAPSHAAYGAAKAGLSHLVKSMAVEWADHGIRVNAVAPGRIITFRSPSSPQLEVEMRDGGIPARRAGEADEIAKVLLFLSSDLSSYMTGQTLSVDGGWTAANLLVRVNNKPV